LGVDTEDTSVLTLMMIYLLGMIGLL